MSKGFTSSQLIAGDVDTGEEDRARRTIAARAIDAADCALLLEVVGLLPGHESRLTRITHGMPGYRLGCRCKRCRKANANRNVQQRARQRETTTADAPINTTTGES
jgi:hypothetical protein